MLESDRLLDLLFEAEAPARDGQRVCQPCLISDTHPCHKCHKSTSDATAQFRCIDCFPGPLLCKSCILEAHTQNPFHRFEEWSSGFFHQVRPYDLGQVLHLGHNHSPCPSKSALESPLKCQIIHTNGFHQVAFHFCACLDAGDRITQFMRAHLFPSTTKQPNLAFTFQVLRDFHLHSLQSKKAAYDYMGALQRITNNSFPQDNPVSP